MIERRSTDPTDSPHVNVNVASAAPVPKQVAIAMQTAIPRPPVEVLVHNLIHDIESLAAKNGHPLQLSVDAGQISSQIDYILDPVPPRGPFADQTRSSDLLNWVRSMDRYPDARANKSRRAPA